MDKYYIKAVAAPGLLEPNAKGWEVEFGKKYFGRCMEFGNCDGFLLYEIFKNDADKDGAKCIYAFGKIEDANIKKGECHANNKEYPIYVTTTIEKCVLPHGRGIPLSEIRKICPKINQNMQSVGGLIEISKDEYEKMCERLRKID